MCIASVHCTYANADRNSYSHKYVHPNSNSNADRYADSHRYAETSGRIGRTT
jgi:hypothetical protein